MFAFHGYFAMLVMASSRRLQDNASSIAILARSEELLSPSAGRCDLLTNSRYRMPSQTSSNLVCPSSCCSCCKVPSGSKTSFRCILGRGTNTHSLVVPSQRECLSPMHFEHERIWFVDCQLHANEKLGPIVNVLSTAQPQCSDMSATERNKLQKIADAKAFYTEHQTSALGKIQPRLDSVRPWYFAFDCFADGALIKSLAFVPARLIRQSHPIEQRVREDSQRDVNKSLTKTWMRARQAYAAKDILASPCDGLQAEAANIVSNYACTSGSTHANVIVSDAENFELDLFYSQAPSQVVDLGVFPSNSDRTYWAKEGNGRTTALKWAFKGSPMWGAGPAELLMNVEVRRFKYAEDERHAQQFANLLDTAFGLTPVRSIVPGIDDGLDINYAPSEESTLSEAFFNYGTKLREISDRYVEEHADAIKQMKIQLFNEAWFQEAMVKYGCELPPQP